jgi:hypothetical protein
MKIKDYLLRNSDQMCVLIGDVAECVVGRGMACMHLMAIRGDAFWCGCCSHPILDCEVWHTYLKCQPVVISDQ